MKKSINSFVLVTVALLSLFACGKGQSGGNKPPAPQGSLYGNGITTVVVSNYDDTNSYEMSNLRCVLDALSAKMNEYPALVGDAAEKSAHELVLGDTTREISKKAMEILDARIKRAVRYEPDEDYAEKDLTGYAIYAEGGSVAIAYRDFQVRELALNFFVDNYLIGDTLVLDDGYVKTEVFSLTTYLDERADEIIDGQWAELESVLLEKAPDYSAAIVSELKNLYTLYGPEMVSWLANLYDPVTGGFYHSNSARDTLGFLPDIENTYVALTFVAESGMAEMFDDEWWSALPRWMLEDIAEWMISLQDSDTFFYHPQWPKEYIVANNLQSRITRDRGSAREVIRRIGYSPKYSSYPATNTELPSPLNGASSVVAASKVVSTAEMLEQYQSVEKFRAYIDGFEKQLETANDEQKTSYFYGWGNLFQSTTYMLTPEMREILLNFFDKHQSPNTGMWSEELYYNSTNALHKVGSVYNALARAMNYTDKQVESIVKILAFDFEEKPASNGVDIYNAWSCFAYIYNNFLTYGEGTVEEREAIVKGYKDYVYSVAPALINNSYTHMADFRRPDGSFGYTRHGSLTTNQGCPSAVYGVHEGDVNGNQIASLAIIQYIFGALGIGDYQVDLFTEAERRQFEDIIENLGPVIKNEIEIGEEVVHTFEDINEGSLPAEFEVFVSGNPIPGAYAEVRREGYNNVLEFLAKNRGNDASGRNPAVKIPLEMLTVSANVAIVEMDMKFKLEGCDLNNSELIQLNLEGNGSPVLYPTFRIDSKGDLWIYTYSGNPMTNIGPADEEFKFRLEYYWELGVYKLYINDVFRYAGDDTYNSRAHQVVNSLILGTPSTINARYTVDNLQCSKTYKEYVDGSSELLAEKVHRFASKDLPAEMKMSVNKNYSFVKNGGDYALRVNNSSLTAPVLTVNSNMRNYGPNAAVVEFDLSVPNPEKATSKDLLATNVTMLNTAGKKMWQMGIYVNTSGKLCFMDSVCLPDKVTTDISAAETTKIRIVGFSGVGASKCDDIMMVYVGGSNTPIFYTTTMVEATAGDNRMYSAQIGSTKSSNGGLSVIYDNVRVETTVLEYKSPVTIPADKVPGPDSALIDFEDYNVGETLPGRFTGDATVGAEFDASNRFLEIKDGSKTSTVSVEIAPFNDTSKTPNMYSFEFDLEYMYASTGDAHLFSIVDKDGNVEDVFKLTLSAYGSSTAVRPMVHNNVKKWNIGASNLDESPSIVTRSALKAGKVTGNAGGASKVRVKVLVDLNSKTVQLVFNEKYNSLYAGGAVTLYTAGFDSVSALRITSFDKSESVLTLDNVLARSYRVSPPTENTSPEHKFDSDKNTSADTYIENGAKVDKADGDVYYTGGTDGAIVLSGSGAALHLPAYKESGVKANKITASFDFEFDTLLKSNSASFALLDNNGVAFTSFAIHEGSDGTVRIAHYSGSLARLIKYTYNKNSFTGGKIPFVTTEGYEELGQAAQQLVKTRFTVLVEYYYDTGLVTVTLVGEDTKVETVYSALVTKVPSVSGVKISVNSDTAATIKLYGADIECVEDDTFDEKPVIGEITVTDFEDDYYSEDVEWVCTHTGHNGKNPQKATNLIFETGVRADYTADANYSNVHGSKASVETEGNNRYLKLTVPGRVSGRDRAHGIVAYTQKVSLNTASYVFEADLRLDSSSNKTFMQMILYNNSSKYCQFNMSEDGTNIFINGVRAGKWNQWFNLRLEYYPTEELILLYCDNEFRGVITSTAGGSSSPYGVRNLQGELNEVRISGVYNFSMGIDNVKLYTSENTYSDPNQPK